MHIITKPTASSQGLSMLELMVAVVIIVLLVSISFPVTLQIRQQAATSVTISHMRDILTGFATYASDHDNRYPGMKLVNKDGGEERWLGANGPIFRQLYRNGNAGPDYIEAGAHLFRTVFVNEQSVKAFPDELDYYNHTYCFNVSLITDALNKDDPDCIYQSRSRFLFPSESQTMLIIEADGRDMNTIQWRDTGRLERAMARNWNKFIRPAL